MELLKQRILRDGQVKEGGVLKVDSFLNHQMDVTLLNEIGREFRRRFDGAAITKIVTIEASGIGIAAIAAQHFGSVPVIFAKKTRSRNLDGALYTAKVHSFTKDITYDVQLSKKFLGPQDTVLILDDFLARGQALLGISKPVIKAHGSSDAYAIKNAVRQAKQFASSGIIESITDNVDVMRLEVTQL